LRGILNSEVGHAATIRMMDVQLADFQSIAKDAQADASVYSSALDAAVVSLPLHTGDRQRDIIDRLVAPTMEMGGKPMPWKRVSSRPVRNWMACVRISRGREPRVVPMR
jgi:hypothetical protein